MRKREHSRGLVKVPNPNFSLKVPSKGPSRPRNVPSPRRRQQAARQHGRGCADDDGERAAEDPSTHPRSDVAPALTKERIVVL